MSCCGDSALILAIAARMEVYVWHVTYLGLEPGIDGEGSASVLRARFWFKKQLENHATSACLALPRAL